MSKITVKPRSAGTVLRPPDADPVELVPAPPSSGFLSFRYTRTEISSHGGRTHVRTRQTRLEDGKLSSESFEGELAGDAAGKAMQRAQQQMLDHMAAMLRPLTWWLPALPRRRPDED